jgi:mannose-6-phosphate isomerase-like protein (cupin superfamily)
MKVIYGKGFEVSKPLTEKQISNFRAELSLLPQFEPTTENYFIKDGEGFLYCRKVSRPKDIATLGRVHKKEHFYIVAKGRIAIRGETGTVFYDAGDVVISKAGTQRLVVSVEDSVTITMHRVSSTNIEDVEKELVEDDEKSNYKAGNKVKQGILKHAEMELI